jgi:hypothetical protein
LFIRGRRWAIAAAFVVTVGQKASTQVTRATAIRDTMATYTGRWRDELPTTLARVATVQVRFRGRRTALSMFAYWRATVEGPASYGHMGVSLYNMRVTEVMELRRSAPTDCRQ